MKKLLLFACAFNFLAMSRGEDVKREQFAGKSYTIIRVNLDEQRLQLFWKDDSGAPFKSFDAVQSSLIKHGRKLVFAMNAGMYHRDFATVGLYVENGKQLSPLNLQRGDGNFFMLPNGVFAITKSGAQVMESSQFSTFHANVTLATQSGPMLVIDGKIHPAFRPGSDSRLFRNGVGVVSAKMVCFAISEEPVNFHEFALLFRDHLHCPNALFFDGTVSSLYSETLKRDDRKIDLGPMIGITAEK